MSATLPFEHLDKACYAATSAAHGLSNAPTWALRITGELPSPALRQATAWLLSAYPSAGARVEATDAPQRRFVWRLPGDLDAAVDAALTLHPPAEDAAAAKATGDAVRSRFLDLEAGPPLRLDWQPDADAEPGGWLYLQQHHGLADGRAFIDLLARFARLLDAACRGAEPAPEDLAPNTRRSELAALELSAGQRRWWTLRGAWIYLRGAITGLLRPTTPLWQNAGLDYTGADRTLHLPLSAARQEALSRAARGAGANLHAALLTAWVRASMALSGERGVPATRVMLSSIVELRPRADPAGFGSFANHLGWVLPTIDAARTPGFAAMCAALHAEMRRQLKAGEVVQRFLFERWGLARLAMAGLREGLARPKSAVVHCNASNVLAIPVPRLAGAGFEVTHVRVTTPVSPRYGALLTITQYGAEATLNVNVKASVIDDDAAARLAALLEAELSGFADGADDAG